MRHGNAINISLVCMLCFAIMLSPSLCIFSDTPASGDSPRGSDVIDGNIQSSINRMMNGFSTGFFRNTGQRDESTLFFISSSEFVVDIQTSQLVISLHKADMDEIILNFPGSNSVQPSCEGEHESRINLFQGSDSTKWITGPSEFDRIVFNDLYPSIDLVYYIQDGKLKYDFVVHPGGNPEDIRLSWSGPVNVDITDEGCIVSADATTRNESVPLLVDTSPYSYSLDDMSEEIASSFVLYDSSYGFAVSEYDKSKTLVIDPAIMTYSTLFVGDSGEVAGDIKVCPNGDILVAGHSDSTTIPLLYEYSDNAGGIDILIFKLSADGSELLFCTFVGGSGTDFFEGLAIDSAGNIFVTARTRSTDFPTKNAYNSTGDGSSEYDAVVFRLRADGRELIFSTYLAGSSNDYPTGIGIDSFGNVVVCGSTYSMDFPVTEGVLGETRNLESEGFVSKLSANGSILQCSTYFGGSEGDNIDSIQVDEDGNIYICGDTNSIDIPIANAIDGVGDGSNMSMDGFVAKLVPDLSAVIFSTYISGSGNERELLLDRDKENNIYLLGETNSFDIPLYNPISDNITGTGYDIFAAKISADGSSFEYFTYLGGNSTESLTGISVDQFGCLYGALSTDQDFLVTDDAFDNVGDGTSYLDVVFFKISSSGDELLYSSYLGGSAGETFARICAHSGSVYILLQTSSEDYPLMNPYQDTPDADPLRGDLAITVFSMVEKPDPPSWLTANMVGSAIQLNWDDPANTGNSPILNFRVYKSLSAGSFSSGNLIAEMQGNLFIDTAVEVDTDYYYVVTAVNAYGESVYSVEVHASIPAAMANSTTTTTTTTTNEPPWAIFGISTETLALIIGFVALIAAIGAIITRRKT
ncbi:MAG: exported protein of unknown function [Candidatus Thorarchaeota archaeon]|nr:MAG: exported protein of unknown function [Candidatus Thorarchaeota archaeon]